MITLIYLTGIALAFTIAAALADYLPWGRDEWVAVHNELALNASWLRLTILRHRGERQLLRRLQYRLLIAAAAPLGRILFGRTPIERTHHHDHR